MRIELHLLSQRPSMTVDYCIKIIFLANEFLHPLAGISAYVIRSRFDRREARANMGREIREGARGVRERPFLAIERGSAGFPENLAAAHMGTCSVEPAWGGA